MADRVLQVRFLGDTDQLGKSVEGIGSKFSGLKVAAAAAAAGAGVAISQGIASTLSTEVAQKKLQAQLGSVGPLAAQAGQVAGSLYSHAYGENLGQVNDAVRSVITSGALMANASSSQIEGITAKAMSLSQAFNIDVGDSMRSVGQLVKTGLAPNATAAMDLITVSFQKFGPQAHDVLDTVTEYSTQFRKLGISGPQAMGLISQGLKAGARDTNTIADALKEFSIRAIDGSKTTAAGFAAIGLSAGDMAQKFAQGGPVAAGALDMVMNRLRGMKDPVAQQTAAVALFGTKAEDLGASLFALDPSSAVAAMGKVGGAAAALDTTINDTAQSKITGMQRSWESLTMSLVSTQGPLGTAAAGVLAFGQSTLGIAGNLGMVAVAFGPFSGQIFALASSVASATGTMIVSVIGWAGTMIVQGAVAVGSMAATAISVVGGWIVMGAQATAQAARMAAAWFIAMGPIGWAIAAVVGVVALVIMNWERVKSFTIGAWNAISGAVANGIGAVLGWLGSLPGRAIGAMGDLPGLFWNVGMGIIRGIGSGISAGWSYLTSLVSNIAHSLFNTAKSALGISSPSKLFATMGREIPAGMAVGIDAGAGQVRDAVARMSNVAASASPSASVAVASSGSLAGAASGVAGAVKLVIDSGGNQLDDLLVRVLKEAIRNRGGDPMILGV